MSFTARARSRIALVVLPVAVALGLAACGPPPDSYVALGDSFTAGPAITPQDPSVPGCLRSLADYPHLLAPSLGQPAFRDASCSGARTRDMTQTQRVDPDPDNPPQLDALDASTRLVTLGIGGNDIGFTEIAQTCVRLFAQQRDGSPCRDFYNEGGVDVIGARIAALAPAFEDVLEGIASRSPRAEVFAVGYPAVLPETTDLFELCQPVLPVAKGDVAWLRDDVEKRLNDTIRFVTVANGDVYVDTYGPSIGHDACQPVGTRWVEPLVPAMDAAPIHPNRLGMQATAEAVRAAMRANGVPVS
jgi:lysophospholipase L1-like esterase